MRTTLNLEDDALIAAQALARRQKISLGEAVSVLVRKGAAAGSESSATRASAPLRGRFALLPRRDEVITAEHIRDLMEREGV